jgi:hypothetical protein
MSARNLGRHVSQHRNVHEEESRPVEAGNHVTMIIDIQNFYNVWVLVQGVQAVNDSTIHRCRVGCLKSVVAHNQLLKVATRHLIDGLDSGRSRIPFQVDEDIVIPASNVVPVRACDDGHHLTRGSILVGGVPVEGGTRQLPRSELWYC